MASYYFQVPICCLFGSLIISVSVLVSKQQSMIERGGRVTRSSRGGRGNTEPPERERDLRDIEMDNLRRQV